MSTTIPDTNENVQKPKKGGLEGIVAATTALSKVEGTAGRLIYHGYDIHDLATTTSFEEIAHLLWFGHLPNRDELADLKAKLAAERTIPAAVLQVIRDLPTTTEPMDALRTAVSAWGAATATIKGKPTIAQAIALTARFPLLLAAFQRIRTGLEVVESTSELGYAANYLYLLSGKMPEPQHVKALDAYLVLLADHGMNASTFTARVVASTESDIVSATVAAIGALKGPLHGGAPSKVKDMLDAIGTVENAENWLRSAMAVGQRLMGFGHRVYTNVEFYSAVLLSSVGLPGDLFTPTFAVSRVAGWTAHTLEQIGNNRLIRPEADYTGTTGERFVPLNER